MSLRKALVSLPDDRDTSAAVREVVSYLSEHRSQPIDVPRITRVTGLSETMVVRVMTALADTFVVDCDGAPGTHPCVFEPDLVLRLEVERYLRAADGSSAELQRRVDRFRGRPGASPSKGYRS